MHQETNAAGIMDEVCRFLIDHAGETITLDRLSIVSGYSAAHLQKVFRSVTGMSPKQFHRSQRARVLKSALRRDASVADAVYTAGYGSMSRVYGELAVLLGMTPAEYKKRGLGTHIRYVEALTRLGWMGLGATERGICFLQFADDRNLLRAALEAEFADAVVEAMPDQSRPEFGRWLAAIEGYLEKTRGLSELPLDLRGTVFQLSVWTFLQSIPAGEVRSYGEVAAAVGRPRAVRAVASACATNRVALLVPCHRVLRGDGSLGGYKWGVERKASLLNNEAATPGGMA